MQQAATEHDQELAQVGEAAPTMNKKRMLCNDQVIMIGKKVEVCLRLFDIFERKRVFIFLCGSSGSPRGEWALQ